MLKKNKGKLILSSILILLPSLVGLFLWERLPTHMAIHWGVTGNADGWASRIFTVLGMPLILLALHWLGMLFTAKDPRSENQNRKAMQIIFWIVPVISLGSQGAMYAVALGNADISLALVPLLLGILFICIGNYLPKCRQNRTLGIKIRWTLCNEENWNATHRFAGKVWAIGGCCFLLLAFLPSNVMAGTLPILAVPMAVLPVLYSYWFYKKQLASGKAEAKDFRYPENRKVRTAVISSFVLLAVVLWFLLCTGSVSVTLAEDSFTVDSYFLGGLTLDYADITGIEYRTEDDPGTRVYGYGSARLLMGSFRNEEFGDYTRYAYAGCASCIVIRTEDKVLVINGATVEETEALYAALAEKVSGQ